MPKEEFPSPSQTPQGTGGQPVETARTEVANEQDSPILPQTSPPDVIARLIRDEIERDRCYFRFAQEQAQKDREYFKHLFDRGIQFAKFLVFIATAVVGFSGYTSCKQIRDEAKATVDAEIRAIRREMQDVSAESKKRIQERLDSTEREVKQRVDEQFQTDRIREIVAEVAVRRSDQVIARQTQSRVDQVVAAKIDPTLLRIDEFGKVTRIELLTARAAGDDRRAFDEIVALARGNPGSERIRNLSSGLIASKQERFKQLSKYVRTPLTNTPRLNSQKALEELRSDNRERQLQALVSHLEGNSEILEKLLDVIINGESVELVMRAYAQFNALTAQDFEFPDYQSVARWWQSVGKNRSERQE